MVRVAAYAGLRRGELLALRWRDVDFEGHALTVSRAISAGVESSTKIRPIRRVPMPDQAAAALDRLSRREDFTAPGELVFVNALGRALKVQRCGDASRPHVTQQEFSRFAFTTSDTPTARCWLQRVWTS
jgi:integrase